MKYVASHKGPSSVTFRTLFRHFGQTAIVTHVVCGNWSKFSDEKGEDLTFTKNLFPEKQDAKNKLYENSKPRRREISRIWGRRSAGGVYI